MKKILFLIVVSCLILGFSTTTMAETTIYLDVWGGGNYKFDSHYRDEWYVNDNLLSINTGTAEVDDELSGYTIGFESKFNKIKVGVEYGIINSDVFIKYDGIKDQNKTDFDFIFAKAKGGYQVIDTEMFELAIIAEVLDINGEYNIDNLNKEVMNIGGNMMGLDFNINFSEYISLQGTLASSLLGANVYSYEKDPSVTEYIIKLNYFITDNWALALGYRSYQFSASRSEIEFGGTTDKYIFNAEMEGSLSGYTLGVAYRF
ncbi:MAG: hypothetical protein GX075_03810 [Firmicutes bacterium]|nr:hypothetical protein [Bacillota bacterium]